MSTVVLGVAPALVPELLLAQPAAASAVTASAATAGAAFLPFKGAFPLI